MLSRCKFLAESIDYLNSHSVLQVCSAIDQSKPPFNKKLGYNKAVDIINYTLVQKNWLKKTNFYRNRMGNCSVINALNVLSIEQPAG